MNYSNETLREAIGILLDYIDGTLHEGAHWQGQSPDWFVATAMMACDIPERAGEEGSAIKSIRTLARNQSVPETEFQCGPTTLL